MPTYQYACTACGDNLEAVQSFTDAALTECPACGGALRKVFSAVGVVFKGSGFYKTDSRSSAKKDEAAPAAASKSETKSDSRSDTKSDSTPAAAKSDTKAATPSTTSSPAA
ncbi:MAG: FmdB family transcriptional regulator [Pseudonocardiales bacterium]|nr:FmdB family transcriptional regulator [Pseudonocardiales bacterium]